MPYLLCMRLVIGPVRVPLCTIWAASIGRWINRTRRWIVIEALIIKREVGDSTGEANTLHNIGMIYDSQGYSDVALACVLRAKERYEELQSPFDVEEEEEW